MRNKKGISPLIATVLLIGFTIVLAALVMRWGGTLFKTTTSTTGCESQGRLQCTSTQFVFSAAAATYNRAGDQVTTIGANNEGTIPINSVLVQRERYDGTKSGKTVTTPTLTGGASVTLTGATAVPAFGGGAGTCNGGTNPTTDLKSLHVTPVIIYTPSDGSAPCTITCNEQTATISAAGVTCT